MEKLTPAQYRAFIERVQGIVQKHGKEMVGWDEIAPVTLLPTSIVQHWRPKTNEGLERAPRLIVSPANRAYVDMKYDDSTLLGLNWAGNVSVQHAYDWDPAAEVGGAAKAVIGVEAPLWAETAGLHARRRVHGVPAAGRDRRDRLDAAGKSQVGRLRPPSRRAGTAVAGAGDQFLSGAGNPVGAVTRAFT